MFCDRTFLYVYVLHFKHFCPLIGVLVMLNHAVSVAWDCLGSQQHELYRTDRTLRYFLLTPAVLRFVLPRRYVPWKQPFIGDSLLGICEMCIEHGGREFGQSFAAPHCHFQLKSSSVSSERVYCLLRQPASCTKPDIPTQIAVNSIGRARLRKTANVISDSRCAARVAVYCARH